MSNDSHTDRSRRAPDRPFVQRGIGDVGATFACGACGLFKSLMGRRMRKVRGLRQYVCSSCATSPR